MTGHSSTLEREAVSAAGTLAAHTQRMAAVGTPPTRPTARPAATAERGFRVEIQALRAIAVSLVILYHVVPLRMPGGFVGVDVFFVVSGFLISGHLLREVERTGRIGLRDFWARRARRLLPAALLVLVASAVGTFAFAPQTQWQPFLREIGGAALYVENWLLAGDAVDYLAAENMASPAQHYWSLSTEEQFYVLWPLLVLGAVWLSARLGARRRVVLAGVLAAVTAASFGYSLWATTHDAPSAYFATPARAWEFGLGALLALATTQALAGRDKLRSVVSWAGFGAIAYSAFTFTGVTPFPGTAALLPVLGTVAVIWAGAPAGEWSPTRVADFGPVRLLSDLSYSAYLWHWPLVVLLPMALGHPLGTTSKVGIVVATLAAAWLTKVLVEDPVRTHSFLARARSRRTYAATAIGMGVVLATTTGGWLFVQNAVDTARTQSAALVGTECFGGAAMDPAADCADPFAVTETVNPIFARSDRSAGMDCLLPEMSTEVEPCRIDVAGSDQTVALIGDSHAAAWWEGVSGAAEANGWSFQGYLHAGCPALSTDRFTGPNMPAEQPVVCEQWGRDVVAEIAADPDVTTVVTTYRSDVFKFVDGDGDLVNRWSPSVVRAGLQPLVDAGKRVVVLRAVPSTGGVSPDGVLADFSVNTPDCIATSDVDDDPCSGPREQRLVPDSIADAVQDMPGVEVVDLTDHFCDAQTCHTVIGGVVAYVDSNHMSRTFSATLAPYLADALQRLHG
jgi:peptidoglycan/LPS O-acetylase OafA/YrhL